MGMKQIKVTCNLSDGVDETLLEKYSKIIQEEIDNEIMVDMFKMQGWHVVKLDRFKDIMHAVDIDDWCVVNAGAGKWNKFGSTFMFKEKEHASWFMLRWL